MQNPISSPGGMFPDLMMRNKVDVGMFSYRCELKLMFVRSIDPLFYLHHTFLDRVWWQWQARGLPARLTDLSGYTTQRRPPTGWVTATLDDTLNMYGVTQNATVREVMDIGGDLLCFEYVDPPAA